jgi:hypothetical protein
VYVDSTVAFLDILGFKDIISRSESDVALLTRVKAALDVLKRFEHVQGNVARGNLIDGTYGQGFSDNIIIAGEPPWVLGEVAALTQALLEIGFPIRGGIAVGKIYCGDRITFGPALVRAVDIEKSLAIFPRVVIEHSAISKLGPESRSERLSIVAQDTDGKYFVDFFALSASIKEARGLSYNRCMAATKNLIVESLNAFRDDQTKLEKYRWLARYFNATLSKQNLKWIAPIENEGSSAEAHDGPK